MSGIAGAQEGDVAEEVPNIIDNQLSRPSLSERLVTHGPNNRKLEKGKHSVLQVGWASKNHCTNEEELRKNQDEAHEGLRKLEEDRTSDSDFQCTPQIMCAYSFLTLLMQFCVGYIRRK